MSRDMKLVYRKGRWHVAVMYDYGPYGPGWGDPDSTALICLEAEAEAVRELPSVDRPPERAWRWRWADKDDWRYTTSGEVPDLSVQERVAPVVLEEVEISVLSSRERRA